MSKPVYFAHPVNTYGEPVEAAVEELLRTTLGREVESPNKPHHQEGYEQWKRETAESRDKHSAMDYFFEVVQPQCFGCAALSFLDRRMGLGVAGEAKKAHERVEPTWFVEPTKSATPEDLDAFIKDPESGLFLVRPFTEDEIEIVREEVARHQANIKTGEEYDGATLVLSHQETRLRTFYVYGREKRSYAEAHLVSMPIPEGFYPPKE